MNSLKNVFVLIDISSSEDESDFAERASTPLPREAIPNYRVILKNSLSSAEAVADEEEYFDVSADSLEASYKRIKLNSSLSSIDSNSYPQQERNEVAQTSEEIPDSPESPDESMSSDVFVVEEPISNKGSMSSSKVAEYLEKVHQEDASSYFNTPPGTPKKINFLQASPLNDLERRVQTVTTTQTIASQLRTPGSVNLLTRAALSQPAPGLACGCRRLKIGRGHGDNLRFPKSYFNW